MIYQLHELQHAMMTPARIAAEMIQSAFKNPFNPLSYLQSGRTIAAGAEVFERMTRRFGKPALTTAAIAAEDGLSERDAQRRKQALWQFLRTVAGNLSGAMLERRITET